MRHKAHYPERLVGPRTTALPLSLRLQGHLLTLDHPLVMGILNATPDSFYAASRNETEREIAQRAEQIVSEGADIIDVGGCSTRAGSKEPTPEEEWQRLNRALHIVRTEHPEAILSVDTYRSAIAERSVGEYGVQIINDISGGEMDADMFPTVARLGCPYVLTHIQGTPQSMQTNPQYEDVTVEVTQWLAERVDRLHCLGAADIIIDPGFGYGKTLEHNYQLLSHLSHLRQLLPHCPLLAGLSRKSMIWKPLGITPEASLPGTIALNMAALERGAHILRVHDVRAAVQTVQLAQRIINEE